MKAMTREEAKKKFWEKNGIFEQFCSVSYKKIVSTYYEGHRIDNFINKIFNDHEAQLKAKEELIELCKQENTNLSAKCWRYVNKLKKKDTKARSIVAMLFWEYKKKVARYGKHALITGSSYGIFQKAYKILKDNA